ncbi:hypothetical protein DPMN_153435 [Dreissena polymorpha]|uniref:Uncharacterized protein n=1 Tax=Dreissena polymorpha TaxID=45954 RepID=A0A9D4J8A0_DREPO|nr:hypothetical protein DPMN_153435 [Dreissena polymorpha]
MQPHARMDLINFEIHTCHVPEMVGPTRIDKHCAADCTARELANLSTPSMSSNTTLPLKVNNKGIQGNPCWVQKLNVMGYNNGYMV